MTFLSCRRELKNKNMIQILISAKKKTKRGSLPGAWPIQKKYKCYKHKGKSMVLLLLLSLDFTLTVDLVTELSGDLAIKRKHFQYTVGGLICALITQYHNYSETFQNHFFQALILIWPWYSESTYEASSLFLSLLIWLIGWNTGHTW